MSERFLITGGQGFIGAWIARVLLEEEQSVVVLDRSPDNSILSQVVDPERLTEVERVFCDIAETDKVRQVFEETEVTHVIHLAGLQVPTCRGNPVQGASVNVIGTLNVFEAVRALAGQVKMIVYASSSAVAGRAEDYDQGRVPDEGRHVPTTHYGVFKASNEGSARVYFWDFDIPSVGLRPYTVYGVGREIGITSGPTKAIKAAVLRRPFTIPFTGHSSFVYVEDLARIFIDAARASVNGALTLNVRGTIDTVENFLGNLRELFPGGAERLDCHGDPIPIAYDLDETGLQRLLGAENIPRTSIRDGIERTARHFHQLAQAGRLHAKDLG